MFDKFGEFDSVEELNMAAAGLLQEGDKESLGILAQENGIDKEDLEDYMDGMTGELATVFSAAYGKMNMEQKEDIDSKKNVVEKMPLQIIITMLRGMCTSEVIAAAVLKKGKRVSEIYKAMRSEAEKHKSGNMGVSCGTDRELCEIIKSYYTEPEVTFKKKIASLYE